MQCPRSFCWWFLSESFCLKTEEWSAWATAAAVFIALFIPLYLRALDKRKEKNRQAEKLSKVRQLFQAFSGECSILCGGYENNLKPANLRRHIAGYTHQAEWLAKLTLEDFPDALSLRIYFLLTTELPRTRARVEHLNTLQLHIEDDKGVIESIHREISTQQEIADQIANYFLAHEKNLRTVFHRFSIQSWLAKRSLRRSTGTQTSLSGSLD